MRPDNRRADAIAALCDPLAVGVNDATVFAMGTENNCFEFVFGRFQTSRSGRLVLHTDIRMVISRRTDCDTAAAHAKGILEAPNELKVLVVAPDSPKYSPRLDKV